ncbi:T9SS type A sorting domain-containing protein [Pontimicrobium sp. IMCC45349]|uniref:DUF7619 domain-containing protein n=1 Tax=Pontimicrobium sp. IMCC45349 TaxID=3391574 RepID=UPI00399FBD5C
MKQFYLSVLCLFTVAITQAQIINIPDTRLKEMLVNDIIVNYDGSEGFSEKVDTNNDGEIQVSEAEAVIGLNISNINSDVKISNLEGLQYFVNLTFLSLTYNEIANIDLSTFSNLEILHASDNLLTSLDLSNNPNLITVACDFNQITSLSCTNNTLLENLYCSNNQISSLDVSNNLNLIELGCPENLLTTLNVSNNTALTKFNCAANSLSSLDISSNVNLLEFSCGDNQLTSLDVSTNTNMTLLRCGQNQITSLDVSNNVTLTNLSCFSNQITTLDITNNINLTHFFYNDNPQLIYLNEKNGVPTMATFGNNSFYNGSACPNLEYVCADSEEVSTLASYHSAYNFGFFNVSSYCTFVPGGDFYTIYGEQQIDTNLNGCEPTDPIYPNLKYNITNGITDGTIISDESGNYTINVQAGTHTITPILENPTYFTVSPTSITADFPTDPSPLNQDFCITPNGTHNDLEVVIVPLELARPGFDTDYLVFYKNKGNTILSGEVTLNFEDDYMDVLTTTPTADTQSTGMLSWNYSNLQPFETREVFITMTLNTPTDVNYPLNGDDELNFEASITPNDMDETPNDNAHTLKQIVVNSYDPNDKTCLEGATITPDRVGEFVHYLIRFENTGTATAVNVAVRDFIDLDKYDISSLIPLSASHDYYTRIVNGEEVEFIFENIQLPFDDANNDGYVLFKIRTLPTLVLGDTFSNIAGIYFDFNYPIITNNETTTVADNLSISEFEGLQSLTLYPNPVTDSFTINSTNNTEIESVILIDISGKTLKQFTVSESYNISDLAAGIYFVQIKSKNATSTKKIIKSN